MQRLFLECAVRAALIALGTAAVLRVLRVKSAGARHAAWTGVVALMLLLPAWMAWGPRASLRVLPTPPAPVSSPVLDVTPVMLLISRPSAAVVPEHWNWLAIVYFSGLFVLLLRLAIGMLRAHALVRGATLRDGRLTSPRCAAPITVGWLRPAVILPEYWRAWSPAQLDAVLTHEGAHVRRRDPLVQWLALLNRAIFWFHPLAWWLERRLSALAEESCDAAVLERGHDPRDYSGYLLELARFIGQSGARVNLVGMAMPGSSLPRRIRQILTSAPAPRLNRPRALCLALACVAISVLAAANIQALAPPPPPPAPPAAIAPEAPPVPPAPPVSFATEAPPVPPAPPVAFAPEVPPAPPAPPVSFGSEAPPAPPAAAEYEFSPPPPPPAAPHPVPAPPPPAQLPAPPQDAKRMVVLYFDLDGAKTEVQASAVAAAKEFVESQMRSTDKAAITTWTSGKLKVVEDFTGDRDRLIGSLGHLESSANSAAHGSDGFLAATSAATRALLALRMSGKITLLYFSAGPAQVPALSDDSNVAVYTIYLGQTSADRK